eukprot:COSAG06_NODE_265_length_18834_cov_10.938991_7_plen_315_part_00
MKIECLCSKNHSLFHRRTTCCVSPRHRAGATMAAMAAVTTTTELKKPVRVSMAGIGHVDEREVEYMTETVCDDTSKPIRAAAEKEAGVESIQVDPHKTTDTFDYHGNFDSKRFELWFEKLCKLAFFECAGRDFNEKDEQRYENGLTTFDWTATPSETYDMCPSLANAGEEGDCDVNEYGCLFQLDGAKYHRRVTNPSPTKSAKRTYMVDWLQANHPTAITPDQVQTGGLTRPKLWEIIKPRKPKKEFAMYKISRKYGHDVRAWPVCPLTQSTIHTPSLLEPSLTLDSCDCGYHSGFHDRSSSLPRIILEAHPSR